MSDKTPTTEPSRGWVLVPVTDIQNLRALVTRLTDKLEDYTRDADHGDSDLSAAIYCGRNFIYG